MHPKWSFQFHFGTIKTVKNIVGRIKVIVFQFHFGTIKTFASAYHSSCNSLFQFHFGTIKTVRLFASYQASDISIPLWYDKNQNRHCRESLPLPFQFHFGTIKTLLPSGRSPGIPLFQFHFGTIKTNGIVKRMHP